jgi:hypothetical protein
MNPIVAAMTYPSDSVAGRVIGEAIELAAL